MNVYTIEYPCGGNKWRVKVLASTAKEAKQNANMAWFGPISKMKVVDIKTTLHNTFDAERVERKSL